MNTRRTGPTYELSAVICGAIGICAALGAAAISAQSKNNPIVTQECRWDLAVFLLGTAFFVCNWSWHLLESLPSRVAELGEIPWRSWVGAWAVLVGVCGVGFGIFMGALCHSSAPSADVFAAIVFLLFAIASFVTAKDDHRRFSHHAESPYREREHNPPSSGVN